MKCQCLLLSTDVVLSELSVVGYAATSGEVLFKTILIFESVISFMITCLAIPKSQMMVILYIEV